MPDPTASSLLTVFLADQDHPCPQCEYNLRNLQGTRCPECGEELVLRVNAAEPRQRLLIAGLIGLSAGAGLNGLLLVYLLIVTMRFSGRISDKTVWTACGLGLAVEAAAMVAWLFFWRRIRRLSVALRVLLALGCWGLTMIDIVIFSFTIR